MTNITDINKSTNNQNDDLDPYIAQLQTGLMILGVAILLICIWVIIILLRCEHIQSQFKILYANLFLADGCFGVTLFIQQLIYSTSFPVCAVVYVFNSSSHFEYILTILVICGDRMISLWKVTPYILRFSKCCVGTITLSTWFTSFLIQSSIFIDGFQNYTECHWKKKMGAICKLIVGLSTILSLIACVLCTIVTIVLQRGHLQVVTSAPDVNRRHIVREYFKTACKEIPICLLSLCLFAPTSVYYIVFYYDPGLSNMIVKISALASLVFRVFSSTVICGLRFPEFRYKLVKATCFFSGSLRKWSDNKLEILYPTIPDMKEFSTTQSNVGKAIESTCGIELVAVLPEGRFRSAANEHRNVICPWDDL